MGDRIYSTDDSNEEDSNYEILHDSDYDVDVDDNILFDENVDNDIDHLGRGKEIVSMNEGFEMDCVEDNELVIRNSSDEDEEVFSRYHPLEGSSKDFDFKLAMIFSSFDEFKNAVKLQAINKGKEIRFAKNDKTRVKVVCKVKDCPWFIRVSPMQEGHCVQIKTFNPCKHACAAIWRKCDEPEDYVHEWYSIETYQRSYAPVVMPIRGQELWPSSNRIPPLPPSYPLRKGRPQTLRRKGPNEKEESDQKMKRKQKSLRCSYCREVGHNVRGCSSKKKAKEATMG